MAEIKDTRFVADDAIRDEDILLDNNDWLRARNAANDADINVLKVDASNRVHISDSANALPVVMGAQLASDPTGVAGGFYYNTTTNVFRFYNGTTWADLGGGSSFPLLATDGTAAAPSYSFAADPDTGMYRVGADELALTVGGTRRLRIDINGAILPSSDNSGAFGTDSTLWGTAFINRVTAGKASTTGDVTFINSISGVPSGANIGGLRLNHTVDISRDLGLATASQSAFDTRSIRFETGNATGASNNSGDFVFRSGVVSGSGTRGKIKLVDGSEGTVGHVWTSTGVAGEGAWQAGGGVTYPL